MATSAQNQGLPTPGYPMVDSTGKIGPVWYQFFSSLWQRTGGGSNSGNVQSVAVTSGSGITSSVTNPTTDVAINLTLGAISPLSVSSTGQISGSTGYFTGGISNFGKMQFGTYTAGAIAATGYITITDISGNTQKLMVGA